MEFSTVMQEGHLGVIYKINNLGNDCTSATLLRKILSVLTRAIRLLV